MKVTLIFEKQSEKEYSCIVEERFQDFGLIGYGATAREAEEDLYTSLKETEDILKEQGKSIPEITFRNKKFDVGSFFSYYPFFNITQFAKFIGLTPSQLRQYSSNIRIPTQKKKDLINTAIKDIATQFKEESKYICID